MTQADKLMTEIERHADAILRAAGSSLRNYTMPATRRAILEAVLATYEAGHCNGVDCTMQPQGEA